MLRRYVPGIAGADDPLMWYEGSGASDRRWLLKDQQGSVIAVANPSGQALGINSYDAAGAPGQANLGRYQYTGQTWLPEIGVYNYKARLYSPTIGRFLQTDPIGYGDGPNWYAYTHGDPVNGSDPSGTTSGDGDDPCLANDCPQDSGGGGGDPGDSGGGDAPPSPPQPPQQPYCTGTLICGSNNQGPDPFTGGGCSGNCGGRWVYDGKGTAIAGLQYQTIDGAPASYNEDTTANFYTYVPNPSGAGLGTAGLAFSEGVMQVAANTRPTIQCFPRQANCTAFVYACLSQPKSYARQHQDSSSAELTCNQMSFQRRSPANDNPLLGDETVCVGSVCFTIHRNGLVSPPHP